MSSQTAEQITHDRINLTRLVRRLEKSVYQAEWNDNTRQDTWIKIQSTLQKLKYAKELLKNVELYATDSSPKIVDRLKHFSLTLEDVQARLINMEQEMTPPPARPKSLLPSIPIPSHSEEPQADARSSTLNEEPVADVLPPSPLNKSSFSKSPDQNPGAPVVLSLGSPVNNLIPTTPALPTKSTATGTANLLQNSNALQQELADQLAQMALQLKRNAVHFSESLEKDKGVVEAAQEKIERNYDVMKLERLRLRDLRGKSGSTTCLVMLSVIVVTISMIIMFFIIRLT